VYQLVDDDPSPVSRWLPAFARWVGAPPPPQVTEQEGRERGREDAVYYGTKLRGATNGKAKKTLHFTPRRLQWLDQWRVVAGVRGCTEPAAAPDRGRRSGFAGFVAHSGGPGR
jgi:hypothetical protein